MSRVNPIQIQKFLKGVDYPASKEALLENAKKLGADEKVCASLEQLPDEEFQTPAEVSQAFGKLREPAEETSGAAESENFLVQAMRDSLAEIEMCELALEKTSNDEIKMFSQQMLDEHNRMGQQIGRLASKKKLDLPKELMPEHRTAIDEMAKLSGIEFDRRFMDENVKEHEKDVQLFQDCADKEDDAEIRDLAEKGAQMFGQHLSMAKEIGKRL